jgi:hypothetical protein
MSDQENIKDLGERIGRATGGDPDKLRSVFEHIKGLAADARDVRPVDFIRPLRPGPSRAEIWAQFATAFAPQLGQISAEAVATRADEMMVEYDKRFAQAAPESEHEGHAAT